jgi:hypothetical protein
MLDFIHRLYEAEESITILSQLVSSRLFLSFLSLVILQALLGTLIPLLLLGLVSPALHSRSMVKLPDELRRLLYAGAAVLIQVGIFSTRWNVVIGGQLFSKRGLTVYKMEYLGLEGLFMSIFLLLLPLLLLLALIAVLPPWPEAEQHPTGT